MPKGTFEIPKVELEVVADHSNEREGFLTVRRFDLVLLNKESGTRSKSFRYDVVERRALDASIMAAHHVRGSDGVRCVYLRSAIRPPAGLRKDGPSGGSGVLWELPAGLIEPGESPNVGAARELEEELGFSCSAESMIPLGDWMLPAPGFIAEVHYFFHVEVDPNTRKEPGGDGSPLEDAARIVSVPIAEALAACNDGTIRDSKTELALYRLARLFPS
jgi:ADP-ribose pyrophosphatase